MIVPIDIVAGESSSEAELISRVKLGDRQAFELLYRSYYQRVYRFACRVLGNPKHADDVINDTMYVVWNKAATYDGSSKLSTWIFGIAYNKARKYLSLSPVLEPGKNDTEAAGESNLLRRIEDRNWLEQGLAVLSPEQRTVVELTYFYEMQYQDIAQIMECSENTVKTRMFYARKKLNEFLKPDQ